MKVNRSEIIELVEQLNKETYEQLEDDDEYSYFECATNGYADYISFCGLKVWDSETDDRSYIFENTYQEQLEPISDYVRRETTRLCRRIGMLNYADIVDLEEAYKEQGYDYRTGLKTD